MVGSLIAWLLNSLLIGGFCAIYMELRGADGDVSGGRGIGYVCLADSIERR